MKPVSFVCIIPVFFCLFCLAGCFRERVSSVVREDLFTLEIGRLEDQIDIFNLEGSRSVLKTAVTMRDGLFYISNGNGEKIVRYTSYGDLLFMIYNDETNPPPLTLRTDVAESGTVTRWAFSYPLREPGDIAVDSRKHIYVEDRLPDERHGFSSEQKALLDSIILHFDADGRFVEYLGQEGIGGTPFPRIDGVYTSARDELAVVCRHSAGWTVYWFDADGTVLYLVQLRNEAVPIPPDRQQVFCSVDRIVAAPDERKLYIKVDYYRNTYDESTGTRSGSEPDSSVIWIMDTEDGSYTGTIEVPFFENTVMENNRRVNEKLLYSMLGLIKGRRVFLSYPIDGGYSILILSAGSGSSGEQRRGLIRVSNDELAFNAFDLSEDGILSGFLATELEARVVWWRTDRLAEEVSP